MLIWIVIAGVANAALLDRGNGLIYDNDLDITWLQDTNYAMTSGYDLDGMMIWDEAMAWADQLEYGGFTEWRLPSTSTPVSIQGCNITSSEMGHLYYEELNNLGIRGIDGSFPQAGYGLTNTSFFINLQPKDYWSSTDVYYNDAMRAWLFSFSGGVQTAAALKSNTLFAMAVHNGDIGAPVPEPSTIFLFSSGLLGLAGVSRKNNSINK